MGGKLQNLKFQTMFSHITPKGMMTTWLCVFFPTSVQLSTSKNAVKSTLGFALTKTGLDVCGSF